MGGVGETYGGTRPQRGLTERLLRGGGNRPMGETASNAVYCGAIERLPSYL